MYACASERVRVRVPTLLEPGQDALVATGDVPVVGAGLYGKVTGVPLRPP